MTSHYFEHPLVKLHYYKFGNGQKFMLCFHGFGMHGKQFQLLATTLGHQYTFIGFDLFFHKGTTLNNADLSVVKTGLSKKELAALITDFCQAMRIDRFSMLSYSMGTHYAATIVEEIGNMVDTFIAAAPAALKPGPVVLWFCRNRLGNKMLERFMLSESAIMRVITTLKRVRLLDADGERIFKKEVATPELRLALYATFTYLRFLKTDEQRLISSFAANNIRSIFIFGKYDKQYSPSIGRNFFKKHQPDEVVVLDAGHQMINDNFTQMLTSLL